MEKKDIKKQCNNIRNVIDNAISESFIADNSSDDEKKLIGDIVNQLEGLNKSFKDQIDNLSENTEWNKFCISFLGETNAGKSTLIESMRILYNEETRLEQILKNKNVAIENLKINNDVYSQLLEDLEKIKLQFTNKKWVYGKNKLIITGILCFVCGIFTMFFCSFFLSW